ncbi:tRNA pseudouridine(38-40) synthase TruA [Candidatus Neptunochlamydia vexilliferae]|uniref:tRNA pseudouridine synthase A n=1 Tax=Candidatus Neptunichlamydia vexilliferae TaxID=1651774 RepID=A0ABS0B029_9BACT|nr:tRNA pseudouridine(38-40) synthase TruA [Candidatus Neptunochlamydia vexilliferae]MBF5059743.1 tRNA pseudouridine synthase A 1 [Candidatus Neptunochlamydia vexilliferae]
MKYKMTLSYDGTNYGGWQVQPNRITIQAVLEKVLGCPVTGSGRTDAGVHALCQVAHFSLETPPPDLNALLPPDIRVHNVVPVSNDFHARFSVKKKVYYYHFSSAPDPFNYRFKTRLPHNFDEALLKKALPLLLGTHDFSAFAGSGCGSKDPVKTLYRLDFAPEEGGFRLEFEGSGFLYKMVRNTVGTLLEVATRRRPPEGIQKILASKDRRLAGPTAPPKGLFLAKVDYY